MSRCSPFLNQQYVTVQRQSLVSIPFLDNTTRENHYLREIRFMPLRKGGDFNIGVARAIPMALEVGIRIQDAYLSHPDVVPACAVTSPFFDYFLPTLGSVSTGGLTAGGVWTLPEPLFVPAGAKLYFVVRFNAEATPQLSSELSNLNELGIFVTFIGQRAYDEVAPPMSRVPFAAAWRTPVVTVGEEGVLQEFRSPDAELYNFTKEQVVVQRITARNFLDNGLPTFVRYSDHKGRYINKDLVPLLELHQNGSWNLGSTLESKEFFSVEGTIDSRSAVADGYLRSGDQQGAIFGVVGYRDIPTHVLWGPSLVAPPSMPVAPAGAVARLGPKTPFLPQARVPRKVVP